MAVTGRSAESRHRGPGANSRRELYRRSEVSCLAKEGGTDIMTTDSEKDVDPSVEQARGLRKFFRRLTASEAELFDGSDLVTLVFLGRRHIAGIEPGRAITAKGRIAVRDGRKVLYNPYYELDTPR